MKKIVIYGVGINCDAFIRYARARDFEIVAFIDKYKAGYEYRNFVIKHPDKLKNLIYDEIFLTVEDNIAEIKDFLVNKLNISSDKIKDNCYLNKRYMFSNSKNYQYIFINSRLRQYEILYGELKKNKEVMMSSLLLCENKWKLETDEQLDTYPHVIILQYRSGISFECLLYFKAKFPNSKIVLTLSDTISGEYGYENVLPHFSLAKLKSLSDLIVTYHQIEAEQYQLFYCPHSYSKVAMPSQKNEYDVFFTGLAKNRLDQIHEVYKKLKSEGVRCRFWICGVSREQMLDEHDGIIYNQNLDYETYLKEVNKCECILDIMKIGNVHSLRYAEAVVYNKKYLTNDFSCSNVPCFNNKYMQIFDSVQDIDCNWIKRDMAIDYNYHEEFSPLSFLKKIVKQLFQEKKND